MKPELEDDVAEMIHHLIVSDRQMEPTETCKQQLRDSLNKLIDEHIALPENPGEPVFVRMFHESVNTGRSISVTLVPADCVWLLRKLRKQ